ncbi:hypothetical protein [Streptomyces sp. Rer75]|uniref:hypothetical protein n=1 Tax=Streptomyces sp. Rer75 TaxID=2750011 RepID=UPI0015D0A2ED|nr:hypothetical protein [Streptomyces sp. Rer75]QLH22065.1 hypothetical protein HYQ63_16805 [Streptomyces sp. Rer75]
MRIATLTLCTAALCLIASGPALADQRHDGTATIRVSPLAIAPGTEVEVRAFGCQGTAATATSPVFVSDAELTPDGDGLFSEATIRSTATKGAHRVSVDCGGGVEPGGTGKVSVAVERPPSPVAPVHAGGGGAPRPAETEGRWPRGGVGGAEAYGLVLSGGTAVAVAGLAVRRRRQRQRVGGDV